MAKIHFFNVSRDYTFKVKTSGDEAGFELATYAAAARDTEEGQRWQIYRDAHTMAQVTAVRGHNQFLMLTDDQVLFFPTSDGEGRRVFFVAGGG